MHMVTRNKSMADKSQKYLSQIGSDSLCWLVCWLVCQPFNYVHNYTVLPLANVYASNGLYVLVYPSCMWDKIVQTNKDYNYVDVHSFHHSNLLLWQLLHQEYHVCVIWNWHGCTCGTLSGSGMVRNTCCQRLISRSTQLESTWHIQKCLHSCV